MKASLRFVLMVSALAVFLGGANGALAEEPAAPGNPVVWVKIGRVTVEAEVVSTPEKIYRGLGYRRELPEGQGMLFKMPGVAIQQFCMRGMQFPLDIIWIVQGRVVGLAKQVPPEFTGVVASPLPVNFVLEVPGGFADAYGVKAGDPVSW